MAKQERALELLRAEEVQAGYDNGLINGKNAEARAREEALLLAKCVDYQRELEALDNMRAALSRATAERKAEETYLSLKRAHWYAQSSRE